MKELKVKWKNKEFVNVYLFFGSEEVIIKDYVDFLVNSLLTEYEKDMNLDIFEESAYKEESRFSMDNIIGALNTYPFLSEKRVVIVKNSKLFETSGKKQDKDLIIDYIKEFPDYGVLIFIEKKVEKTSSVYKKINKSDNCQLVECKSLDNKDMVKWVRNEVKKTGHTIENNVAYYFVEKICENLEQGTQELQKLVAYKGENSVITIDDINEICYGKLEVVIFELAQFAIDGEKEKAFEIYKKLLTSKESNTFMIFKMIITQVRNIYLCNELSMAGCSNTEISKLIGIKEYGVKMSLNRARKMDKDKLKNVLKYALDLDLKIKTGLINEEVAVDTFIMYL